MSKTWRESLSRAYHSWVVIDSPLRPGDDKNRIKFRFQCFRLQITDHKKSEEPIRSKFPIAWKEKNNEVSLFVFTSLCCFSSFVSLCTRSRRPQSLHFARFCFVFDVMFSFLCLCIFEIDAFRLAADRLVWLRSWWFWNEENSLRVCLVPDWNLFFFSSCSYMTFWFVFFENWDEERASILYRSQVSFVLSLLCILTCASRSLDYCVWSFNLSLNVFKSVLNSFMRYLSLVDVFLF